MANKVCPYCGDFMTLKDSKIIYGKLSNYGKIWLCSRYPDCDAYVGCHKGTDKPLGTPARKYLRELRMECHDKFDTFWRKKGLTLDELRQRRKESYTWLAGTMGLPKHKAHIAKFNEEQCLELLEHLETNLTIQELQPAREIRFSRTGRPSWF